MNKRRMVFPAAICNEKKKLIKSLISKNISVLNITYIDYIEKY